MIKIKKKVRPGLYQIKFDYKTYYIKTDIFDITAEKFIYYMNRIIKPSVPFDVNFLRTWKFDNIERVFVYDNGVEIKNMYNEKIPEFMGVKQCVGYIDVIDHKIMDEWIKPDTFFELYGKD